MAPIVIVIIAVCFIASLLPFMLPGTALGLIGKVLNDALGDPVWQFLPFTRGTLVVAVGGNPMLTFQGVLVVYGSLLVVMFLWQRGR